MPVGLTLLSFMQIDQRAINPASPGVPSFGDGPGIIHRLEPRRLGAFSCAGNHPYGCAFLRFWARGACIGEIDSATWGLPT